MIYVTKLFDNKGLLLSCSILWRRKRRMLVIRWWHKIIASHFSNFSVSLVYYMFVIVHYLTYNRYSLHCLLYHISSLLTTHSNKLSHVYSLHYSPLLPHSPTFDVVWLSHIDIFTVVSHLFNFNTPFFTVAVHPNKCCNQAHPFSGPAFFAASSTYDHSDPHEQRSEFTWTLLACCRMGYQYQDLSEGVTHSLEHSIAPSLLLTQCILSKTFLV